MPNRIIKESICTSDSIDALTWFEEVLYYRLIVNCDDYGRFDGRTAVIKNRLFPLKDNVTAKSVEQSINKMVTCGLVTLYEFEGKPYLQLPSWEKHQNVRAKKSKYPPYDSDLNTDVCKCMQMYSNVPVIQSNPNTNPNPNTRDNARTCKEKYGEYAHVMLTEAEFDKLGEEYGSAMRDSCIDFLDKYIEENPTYKKASHYLTIKRWVVNAVNEHKGITTTKSGTASARTFNPDEAFKKALEKTYAK